VRPTLAGKHQAGEPVGAEKQSGSRRWKMQLRTIVSALVAATAIGWPVVGEEPSASQKVSQPDPTKVYFLDPLADGIRVIPVEKCKPHHVYFRYSQRLGRHVWSKTDANRVFRYAIGPGSTSRLIPRWDDEPWKSGPQTWPNG
jgi:hypothetical protein